MDKKKADQLASPEKTQRNTITTTNAPTKVSRILAFLVEGGSLNRFEAERLGDHCLNSTISALKNNWGIVFVCRDEKVTTHWGKSCHVTRYSLPDSRLDEARQVLEFMVAGRGCAA
ncbi:hypothetical protein ACUTAH_14315 [Metapseudomonas furukawaii]|uniref:hypothetical protein n=1 Tax=Metapseudomonas furukawaii TaxID=1149133 RepID=UPI00404539BA